MTIAKDSNVGYDIVPRRRSSYPRMNEEFLDLQRAIADFVIDQTSRLQIGQTDRIFLQGSCFAANLYEELKSANFPCFYNEVIEAINSPLANMLYLSQVLRDARGPVYDELRRARVFILTIGVAPCWFLKATGEFVMSPDVRNIGAYSQRTLSVKESTESLAKVLDILHAINPDLSVVITLSPVPLARTFEFESAVVADCVSKSTLRAAIHETIISYPGKKPIYFPAFEIVRWLGAHVGNAFGDDGLPRHVSREYVRLIISSFLEQTARKETPTPQPKS